MKRLKNLFFFGLFVIHLSQCHFQKDTFEPFNSSVDLSKTESFLFHHHSSEDDEGLSVEDLLLFSEDENDTENLAYLTGTPFWPETSPGVYTIYYKISPEFSLRRHFQILYGIDLVERGSNIQLRPAQLETTPLIHFIKSDTECRSLVGFLNDKQDITLAESCFQVGNVVHELFHALGFVHEHHRPDRERFVDFVPSSELPIPMTYEAQKIFFQTDYDVRSVTHYSIANPGPDVEGSFVFRHEKHFLKPFEAEVSRFPSSCDWNGVNTIYRGKKPIPKCNPDMRPPTYYHPSQTLLRFPSTRVDLFRYCGVYYLDIPGPFLCTIDDYNEYPELPWLDEVKHVNSGLVSASGRVKFCKNYKSSNEKQIKSVNCKRKCFYDCRLTHYSKTLEECMKDTPTCIRA